MCPFGVWRNIDPSFAATVAVLVVLAENVYAKERLWGPCVDDICRHSLLPVQFILERACPMCSGSVSSRDSWSTNEMSQVFCLESSKPMNVLRLAIKSLGSRIEHLPSCFLNTGTINCTNKQTTRGRHTNERYHHVRYKVDRVAASVFHHCCLYNPNCTQKSHHFNHSQYEVTHITPNIIEQSQHVSAQNHNNRPLLATEHCSNATNTLPRYS